MEKNTDTAAQVIEGNRLIAEFMDLPNRYISKHMLYHLRWDWLMPVVEKIENMNDGIYSVSIQDKVCYIYERGKLMEAKSGIGATKIQAIYLAVLQFINWYNQQNPTT